MTKTNTKAFTLIELLIVIVIIGILAVALLPRLTAVQKQSRDTSRKTIAQQIAAGIESYRSDNNGTLPGGGLATGAAADSALLSQLVPTYLQNIPKDPRGNSFGYVTGASNTSGYAIIIGVELPNQGNAPTGSSGANLLSGSTYTAAASGDVFAVVNK